MQIDIQPLDVAIFVCVFMSVLIGAFYAQRSWTRSARPSWRTRKGFPRNDGRVVPLDRSRRGVIEPTDQLHHVMNARFTKRRILSKSEARVFFAVEAALERSKAPWRVMAQVNLGEILSSNDEKAFMAINSKRVDMLIISSAGAPIAAIEYQGEGHYQGTSAARDAVKKEALRRAGVGYFEVTQHDTADDVNRLVARIIEVEKLRLIDGAKMKSGAGKMPPRADSPRREGMG